MHTRLTGAVLAALCLIASSVAQPVSARDVTGCLSRLTIQQQLMAKVDPLRAAVAARSPDASAKLEEAIALLERWRTAPEGVDQCWRRKR